MKLMLKTLWSLSILVGFSSHIYAADVKLGEKLSASCVACHGEKGIGHQVMYPNLAGQKPAYLTAQLRAFKSGTRKNMMMEPLATSLSNDDMDHLAAFYASVDNDTVHRSDTNKVTAEIINKAAMCKGCHGRKGEGRGSFPRLRNQHVDYLAAQLKAYRQGTRKGGPMTGIAKALSDEDIKQLSHYFSNLTMEQK